MEAGSLAGMSAAEAKEYILALLTTLKMTEKEAERTNARLAGLREEERTLRERIEYVRKQLPALAARERSIDPDLLEQELLAALGRTEQEAETEKTIKKLEKERAADAALEELKARMSGPNGGEASP